MHHSFLVTVVDHHMGCPFSASWDVTLQRDLSSCLDSFYPKAVIESTKGTEDELSPSSQHRQNVLFLTRIHFNFPGKYTIQKRLAVFLSIGRNLSGILFSSLKLMQESHWFALTSCGKP